MLSRCQETLLHCWALPRTIHQQILRNKAVSISGLHSAQCIYCFSGTVEKGQKKGSQRMKECTQGAAWHPAECVPPSIANRKHRDVETCFIHLAWCWATVDTGLVGAHVERSLSLRVTIRIQNTTWDVASGMMFTGIGFFLCSVILTAVILSHTQTLQPFLCVSCSETRSNRNETQRGFTAPCRLLHLRTSCSSSHLSRILIARGDCLVSPGVSLNSGRPSFLEDFILFNVNENISLCRHKRRQEVSNGF